MTNAIIRRLLLLGGLAIAGILFIQTYSFMRTRNVKLQEFNQTVNIALRKVAESISVYNGTELPKKNLIQRRSSNVYAVNINSAIDANVLEELLEQQFINHSLNTNFEYAVYDCATDDLLYGNFCVLSNIDESTPPEIQDLPKFDDLIYYFVVKFPQREGYLLSTMRQSLIFSIIALLAVCFFLYSIYVILRQKQLTELQKDFINNMTHEFKTPISSIKIASEVLIKSEEVQSSPRLKNYAKIIGDQNKRLDHLVEKVLDIAKLEGDSVKLNKEKIAITHMVRSVAEVEKLKFEELGGSIEVELTTVEYSIEADQLHLNNVITNILDNARKYCDGVPRVKITFSNLSEGLAIKFRDNGVGIDKEQQKKLFNKFYRVPTGNVHNVKGFGLGLFYVKNICQEHGWNIRVSSAGEGGSEFTITIPKSLLKSEENEQ